MLRMARRTVANELVGPIQDRLSTDVASLKTNSAHQSRPSPDRRHRSREVLGEKQGARGKPVTKVRWIKNCDAATDTATSPSLAKIRRPLPAATSAISWPHPQRHHQKRAMISNYLAGRSAALRTMLE
jgi:hypothetical protein